jgi:hypothetical protein
MRTKQTQNDGFRADDVTRSLQYRGADPSGYEYDPAWDDAGDTGGYFTEATPGNAGEPGGRWHDHEMPYVHELNPTGEQSEQWGGFRTVATELYPGGYLGLLAYGQGGREGSIPPELASEAAASAAHFDEDTIEDTIEEIVIEPDEEEPLTLREDKLAPTHDESSDDRSEEGNGTDGR